jgi:hypothetical protein
LSYPARKKDDGTWWKHVWGSDKFNATILKKAQQDKPVAKPKAKPDFDDDSDLPFN